MEAHPGQAAWAQGFFSVLAIGAAIWIDRGSARRAEKREDRATKHRYENGRNALVYALETLKRIQAEVDAADGDSAKLRTHDAKRWLRNAMNVLDYQTGRDHDHPRLVAALFAAQVDMPTLEAALQTYNRSGHSYYQVQGWLRNATASVTTALQKLEGSPSGAPSFSPSPSRDD